MATWKKVIVSGSNAELNSLNVQPNQQISGSAAHTFLSGSFSGSFQGNGSGLTGLATTLRVTGSAGSGSVYLLDQAISILGTSNQIASTAASSSAGTTVTLSLPNSVILPQDLSVSGKLSVTGSAIFLGGITGSFSGSALLPELTNGTGISSLLYNGSSTATVSVSGAASLTTSYIPKWTGTAFNNSNIFDNGSLVTVAANTTFNNNVTVQGDLTVNGTASFINTEELLVKDKFTIFNSGSNTLTDSGFIFQSSTNGGVASGSAFYLDASVGTYGRFAVQKDVLYNVTSVTADEWIPTVKLSTTLPIDAVPPTWGGSNGQGNMWVDTLTGDIFIWS
jgi:hypothetical protein